MQRSCASILSTVVEIALTTAATASVLSTVVEIAAVVADKAPRRWRRGGRDDWGARKGIWIRDNVTWMGHLWWVCKAIRERHGTSIGTDKRSGRNVLDEIHAVRVVGGMVSVVRMISAVMERRR